MLICSPCWYEMFLHIYADSFSVKTYMKLTTFIIPTTRRIFTKLSAVSQSSIKIKVRSISDTFRNFYYQSSYLQTKIFGWKQNSAISAKFRRLQRWSRQFQKALATFCKVPEKKSLNDPYNFQMMFSSFNVQIVIALPNFDQINETKKNKPKKTYNHPVKNNSFLQF